MCPEGSATPRTTAGSHSSSSREAGASCRPHAIQRAWTWLSSRPKTQPCPQLAPPVISHRQVLLPLGAHRLAQAPGSGSERDPGQGERVPAKPGSGDSSGHGRRSRWNVTASLPLIRGSERKGCWGLPSVSCQRSLFGIPGIQAGPATTRPVPAHERHSRYLPLHLRGQWGPAGGPGHFTWAPARAAQGSPPTQRGQPSFRTGHLHTLLHSNPGPGWHKKQMRRG